MLCPYAAFAHDLAVPEPFGLDAGVSISGLGTQSTSMYVFSLLWPEPDFGVSPQQGKVTALPYDACCTGTLRHPQAP